VRSILRRSDGAARAERWACHYYSEWRKLSPKPALWFVTKWRIFLGKANRTKLRPRNFKLPLETAQGRDKVSQKPLKALHFLGVVIVKDHFTKASLHKLGPRFSPIPSFANGVVTLHRLAPSLARSATSTMLFDTHSSCRITSQPRRLEQRRIGKPLPGHRQPEDR